MEKSRDNVIFLYDSNESGSMAARFTHEVTEYKLQNVTRPYRSYDQLLN